VTVLFDLSTEGKRRLLKA